MANNFDRNITREDLMRRRASLLQRMHIDGQLLFILLTIAATGLFILYSASGKDWALVSRQAISFGIGLTGMLIIAQFEPRFMARWVALAYIGGLILLGIVLVAGDGAKGAHRWIHIPGVIRFQPSEIMKLVVPMMVASYLGNRALPPRLKHIVVALALSVVPFGMILVQPDLGTSLLIIVSGGFVLFMGGLQWRWILSAVAAVVPLAIGMWFFVMRDYQKQRVLTFLDPESDPLGSGWNIIQSKTAIGSGGIDGKGWLQGTQSQLEFLPESHTDFIIAVLAEELGLIGVLLLLTLYFLIIMRCLYLSSRCETLFGKLLSGSLSVTFFIYVFVNIGMVSGILPVVGVPLPLVSYGGTSVISLLTAFGVLMSMCTHNKN